MVKSVVYFAHLCFSNDVQQQNCYFKSGFILNIDINIKKKNWIKVFP